MARLAASSPRPPRLAVWTLELLYPAPLATAIAGDLEEEFHAVAASAGPAAANTWYARQVLGSLRYALARRWRQGDVAAFAVATALGAAALWLLSETGRFVLSQVPRKASAELPVLYECARWTAAATLSALCLYWRRHESPTQPGDKRK